MIDRLKSARVAWTAFAVFMALSVGFLVVIAAYDLHIIDEMWRADMIRDHIAGMSASQRTAHAWMTATLDVAYPFAYGIWFAAVARLAFTPKWLAWPGLLCIPADLAEGLAQVMLLTGHAEWMTLKVIATPIKLGLFGVGVVITLAALIRLALRRFRAA